MTRSFITNIFIYFPDTAFPFFISVPALITPRFTETNNFPFDFYKYIKYNKLCLKTMLSQYNQYNYNYYNNDHFKENNKMLNNFLLKLIT